LLLGRKVNESGEASHTNANTAKTNVIPRYQVFSWVYFCRMQRHFFFVFVEIYLLLIVYISCIGGFIVTFPYMLVMYLG
jgi:hypothetical protein